MEQIEGEFIPYKRPLEAYFDFSYAPFEPSNMMTVPAKHPRLSAWFIGIGQWFTEKGESWGERKYFVDTTRCFKKQITFGDYAYDPDPLLSDWSFTKDGEPR